MDIKILFANSMRRVNFRNGAECSDQVNSAVPIKPIARM